MKTYTNIHRKKRIHIDSGLTEKNKTKHSENYNLTKAEKAKQLYQLGIPVKVIVNDLYISRSTLYRYLKEEGLKYESYISHNSKIENIEN